MLNKYAIVKHEKHTFWARRCPVLLQTHALTKNNFDNAMLLQCKFENLSDKIIVAMYIAVKCFDVAHQALPNVPSFAYLDLSVKPYELFGDRVPVSLPDNTTRNVVIIPLKIIFSDDTIWENGSNQEYEQAEIAQRPISSLGELSGLYKQKLNAICLGHAKHKYLPAQKNGFTICGCQKIVMNAATNCPNCGVVFEKLFDISDPNKLQSELSARETEKKKQEEAERKKQEEAERKRIEEEKKRRREEAELKELEEAAKAAPNPCLQEILEEQSQEQPEEQPQPLDQPHQNEYIYNVKPQCKERKHRALHVSKGDIIAILIAVDSLIFLGIIYALAH